MEFTSNNTNIQNLIENYHYIISSLYYSRKKIDFDEFDNEHITDNEIMHEYVRGIFNMVYFPRGCIFFHKKNKWKMDNINRFFMTYKNCISNMNHNLPKQFIIKRSDGTESYSKLLNFESLLMVNEKNDFVANVNFKEDKSKYDYFDIKMTCLYYYNWLYETNREDIITKGIIESDVDLRKNVYLTNILEWNDIDKLIITLDLYSNSFLDSIDNDKAEVYLFFNNKIMEWVNTIVNPFIDKNNLNAIVEYNLISNT
jgi:hypothetical protein